MKIEDKGNRGQRAPTYAQAKSTNLNKTADSEADSTLVDVTDGNIKRP
jgi:hypothetical protein